MKNTKFLGIMALLLAAVTVSAAAQKVKIDYNYKVNTDDPANYFNWTADGTTVKDGFDAASGASKAQSTTKFNSVRFDDTGKKKAVPAGFRSLVLFPVATSAVAQGDNFTVEANGKVITIKFIHRGTASVITTDEKGNINMASSFQSAAGLADNIGGKFVLKDEFVKEGGDKNSMASLDWSKVTLVADKADDDANYIYDGELKASYKDGVLSMKGNLKKVTRAAKK
ncbi:MAG: hypothetical protein WCQ67_01705 [Treponema sp.]